MPAVVRGGRRQSSNQAPRKSAPRKGAPRRGGSRNAPATPGKMAALGRLDLSPPSFREGPGRWRDRRSAPCPWAGDRMRVVETAPNSVADRRELPRA